jgi:hypothetical protein
VCGVVGSGSQGCDSGAADVDPLRDLFAQQVKLSAAEIARLEADNERLRQENTKLHGELAKAQRAGKRQAAPFSRGVKKPDPKRPGRKPGADYGTKARRRPPDPEDVDEQRVAPLPAGCPDCGGQVVCDGVGEQFQEEDPRPYRQAPLRGGVGALHRLSAQGGNRDEDRDDPCTVAGVVGRVRSQIDAFVVGLQSAKTRSNCQANLRAWFCWKGAGGIDALAVERAHVEAYVRDLEAAGNAPNTIRQRIATLASFYAGR